MLQPWDLIALNLIRVRGFVDRKSAVATLAGPIMALTILRARPLASSLVLSGISLTLFSTFSTREAHADSNSPRAVFGKGPAFVSLTLETTEQVNHNTKRLRFKLPHADDVTGLSITCICLQPAALNYKTWQNES